MKLYTISQCTFWIFLISLLLPGAQVEDRYHRQSTNECNNPTLIVKPEQELTVQELINKTGPSTVMLFKPGNYRVNLFIAKNLTLCGESGQKTVFESKQDNLPVIRVISDQAIEVKLINLGITKAKTQPDVSGGTIDMPATINFYPFYKSNLAKLKLQNIRIFKNEAVGIKVAGGKDIHLVLEDSEVFENSHGGIDVNIAGTVQVRRVVFSNNGSESFCGIRPAVSFVSKERGKFILQNVTITRSKCDGLYVGGMAHVNGSKVEIASNGRTGVYLRGGAEVSLIDTLIDRNKGIGINITTDLDDHGLPNKSPNLILEQVRISNNGYSGIISTASATVRLKQVNLVSNGLASSCEQPGPDRGAEYKICTGLELLNESRVTIDSSIIQDNADWGITAHLTECGFNDEPNKFTGKVFFDGHNVIKGNDKTGNQKAIGNPGNHPYGNLPSGNVCLP